MAEILHFQALANSATVCQKVLCLPQRAMTVLAQALIVLNQVRVSRSDQISRYIWADEGIKASHALDALRHFKVGIP